MVVWGLPVCGLPVCVLPMRGNISTPNKLFLYVVKQIESQKFVSLSFICDLAFINQISGERLQEHWSSVLLVFVDGHELIFQGCQRLFKFCNKVVNLCQREQVFVQYL